VLNAVLPSGYTAVLVGSVTSFEELSAFETLEQGQDEYSRMLAQLTFEQRSPDFDYLVGQLNQKCIEAGVTPWPERRDIAIGDPVEPVIYLCWQKGFVWWGWILALLGSVVLPPLIMAGLWLILPDSVKQMVEAIVNISILGIVVFLMSKMTSDLSSGEGT
jgi:hypothetical protein